MQNMLVSRNELLRAIDVICSMPQTPGGHRLAILSTRNGLLRVVGSGIQGAVSANIAVSGAPPHMVGAGHAAVDAAILKNWLSLLDSEAIGVNFVPEDSPRVVLHAGNNKTTLRSAHSSQECMAIAESCAAHISEEPSSECLLDSKVELVSALKGIIGLFRSSDASEYTLDQFYVAFCRISDNWLSVAATDSNRWIEFLVPCEPIRHGEFVVHADFLNMFLSMANSFPYSQLRIAATQNWTAVRETEGRLTVVATNSKMQRPSLELEKMFQQTSIVATVDTKALAAALKRVAILGETVSPTSRKSRVVKLTARASELVVTATNAYVSEGEEPIGADVVNLPAGESVGFNINANYLHHAISSVGGERLEIYMPKSIEERIPLFFGRPGAPSMCVVMPML